MQEIESLKQMLKQAIEMSEILIEENKRLKERIKAQTEKK